MIISVCVGSSCHLKGSYDIIELLKKKIVEDKLEDKVELKAAFCLGKCTNGVSIKVDDEIICGLSTSNFESIYQQKILSKLK